MGVPHRGSCCLWRKCIGEAFSRGNRALSYERHSIKLGSTFLCNAMPMYCGTFVELVVYGDRNGVTEVERDSGTRVHIIDKNEGSGDSIRGM